MTKQHCILLIILLTLLILLPSIAYFTLFLDNDPCTIYCQRINNDTAWNNCMLQCLKETSQ